MAGGQRDEQARLYSIILQNKKSIISSATIISECRVYRHNLWSQVLTERHWKKKPIKIVKCSKQKEIIIKLTHRKHICILLLLLSNGRFEVHTSYACSHCAYARVDKDTSSAFSPIGDMTWSSFFVTCNVILNDTYLTSLSQIFLIAHSTCTNILPGHLTFILWWHMKTKH